MTAGSCDVAIMRPSRGRLTRAPFDVPPKAEEHARMAFLVGSAARVRGAAPAILLIVLGIPGRAWAETSADDKALATVLFKEGRAMLAEGQISLACPKFEESHRLDPSGGTILNLALCHEQEGRLARSWSELNEAAAFARRDRRPDREAIAVEHARALEPRLSTLTIVVPESARTEALRVERDGREVGQASWSTAMPVDGGEHIVRATAPGKEPFAGTVVVAKEGDAQTVEIPPLRGIASVAAPAATPAAVSLVAHPSAPAVDPLVDRGPPKTSGRRTLAWTVGGAGVAQLGVAGYFALRALDKHRQSDVACPGGRCDQNGVSLNDQAATAADVATVLTITGLLSVATGIYLLATSR
jgi:hypothetical protein